MRPFKTLFASCCFLVCFTPVISFSQGETRDESRDTLKDSRTLLVTGVDLYEQGKYKFALKQFDQIPEGDTNYSIAVLESALAYIADSAFAKGKEKAIEGLGLPYCDRRLLLLTLGNACDYLGKQDSALYYYDSVARMNPTDHQPLYEKGALYYNKKENDKAIEYFQAALMVNPYHYRSHYMLGCTYLREGRLTEAFIAILNSLLCTNNIDIARSSIIMLDHITKQTNEVAEAYQAKDEKYAHAMYDDIDQVINARLALNRDYKFESVMDEDQIVRVTHMIMEKLKYDRNDPGFVMQFYVPLLRRIYDAKLFDPYVLILFSGYNIDVVERYAKKQKGDVKDAKEMIFPYFDHIVGTRVLDYTARATAKEKYFMNNNEGIYVVGAFADEQKSRFAEGFTVFYKNNNLSAMGNYNKKGNKEGEWKYFAPAGYLRLTEHYTDGVMTGTAQKWHPSGYIALDRKYDSHGELQEEKEYSYNGVLTSITVVKGEKKTVMTSYHPNGNIEIVLPQQGDKVEDGHYKSWYANGVMEKDLEIRNGKLTGEYKKYHSNGQLMIKSYYKDGNNDGPYTSYYSNGNKEYVCTYDNDKKDGPYEEYDVDGRLIGKGEYRNGKKTLEVFCEDGKEYGTIEYKNEKPVAYRFTRLNGQLIEQRKDGNIARLHVFYPNGNLRTELPMRDGLTNGPARYFYSTGALHEINTYKDDKLEGMSGQFYKNGKPSTHRINMKDRSGAYYKSFFANGQLSQTGWLDRNERVGLWTYFNVNGKPSREVFFVNGEINGPDKNYLINGQSDYTDYFDKGMLIGLVQFDTNGRQFRTEHYPKGNGLYKLLYPNGVSYYECMLKGGLYSGEFRKKFPDGTPMEVGYNISNRIDSTYTVYHFNGRPKVKGQYKDHLFTGTWLYYDEDGNLEREVSFNAGNREGEDKYYSNGVLRYKYHFHNDEKQGDQFIYGDGDKIACILKYEGADLVGYTYTGKDGNLVPVIPIRNGTAKVSSFYGNGAKAMEYTYVENILTGKQQMYYSNGNLAEEFTVENSDFNGPYKKFSVEGKLTYEANYKDDELTGEERTYKPSGELIRSKNYYSGTLNGTSRITDVATNKTTEIYYYYGHPMRIQK